MTNQSEINAAYAAWAERLVKEGFAPYLFSFMFEPMGGTAASMGDRMLAEIERVYRIHVTRVVRKPNAPAHLDDRPVWFCSLDRPVFKHAKQSLRDAVTNDGLHGHAVGFYSPRSRLRVSPVEHFEHCRKLYIGRQHPLDRIDVTPITHRVGYVAGYGRKSVRRGLVGDCSDMVLPIDRSTARALHVSRRVDAIAEAADVPGATAA